MTIQRQVVSEMEEFQCLALTIGNDGKSEKEVKKRIKAGRSN